MASIASRDLALPFTLDESPENADWATECTNCTNKTSKSITLAGDADLAALHHQLADSR